MSPSSRNSAVNSGGIASMLLIIFLEHGQQQCVEIFPLCILPCSISQSPWSLIYIMASRSTDNIYAQHSLASHVQTSGWSHGLCIESFASHLPFTKFDSLQMIGGHFAKYHSCQMFWLYGRGGKAVPIH